VASKAEAAGEAEAEAAATQQTREGSKPQCCRFFRRAEVASFDAPAAPPHHGG